MLRIQQVKETEDADSMQIPSIQSLLHFLNHFLL